MNTSDSRPPSLPLVYNASTETGSSIEDLCSHLRSNKAPILENLYRHGAVLFRDFDASTSQHFEMFAQAIEPQLLNYSGGDSPRKKVDGNVYTSTSFPAEYSISMHHELSYSQNHPKLIMFFCHTPAQSGGETPLLDARQLLKDLSPELVKRFATRKLKYVQNLHAGKGFGKSWQETFEEQERSKVEERLTNLKATFSWKADGGLRVEEIVDPIIVHPITSAKVFFSQADQWHPSNLDQETRESLIEMLGEDNLYHHCFFGDGGPIDEADLNEIRKLHEKLAVKFPWKQGDILLVDNILTMHGRAPFTGPRSILVAMA